MRPKMHMMQTPGIPQKLCFMEDTVLDPEEKLFLHWDLLQIKSQTYSKQRLEPPNEHG